MRGIIFLHQCYHCVRRKSHALIGTSCLVRLGAHALNNSRVTKNREGWCMALLPQVVFNQKGEREASLSKAAHEMEDTFGKLMEQLVNTAVLKSPRYAESSLRMLGVLGLYFAIFLRV